MEEKRKLDRARKQQLAFGMIVLVVSWYNMFMATARAVIVSWDDTPGVPLIFFHFFLDLLLVVNMYIQATTVYEEEGNLIVDRHQVHLLLL